MNGASFDKIKDEFDERVRRIVWCTVVTVDRQGRPRSRVLHPVWEGTTGWIATGRQSFKAKHLAQNPYISLSYWDVQHGLAYVDCRAEWEDSADERRRVWEMYKGTPPPYGYDPAMFWPGPDDASFGLLKLTPWRIELHSLAEMGKGIPSRVWRSGQ
ncbi:MAG: pyridoxamine 5'-phosphate oxidase family protein [Dehalococcoidia bacterium]